MQYFPNPAISARKTAVFPKNSTFSQNKTLKKSINRYPIYQIKAHENLHQMHKKWFSLDK